MSSEIYIMDSRMLPEEKEEAGDTTHHSMHLLWGYKTTFATIFALTLILGAPLSINKWWHLRVSSNRSGRGVIKIIQGCTKKFVLGSENEPS